MSKLIISKPSYGVRDFVINDFSKTKNSLSDGFVTTTSLLKIPPLSNKLFYLWI